MAFRGFQLQTFHFQLFQYLAEGCDVVIKCHPKNDIIQVKNLVLYLY